MVKKMIKFRMLKAGIVMGILLFGSSIPITSTASAITLFQSYLQLYANQTAVTVQPDGPAVSVQIRAQYKVEWLPKGPLSFTWRMLFVGLMKKIHFSVVNKPNWMNVALANPDMMVDVSDEFVEVVNSVIISVYKNAPAEKYTLIIHAEVPGKTIYGGDTAETQITVTPGYIPLINVYTKKPTVEVAPQTSVNFPIEISNEGNKEAIVTGNIVNIPQGWVAYLPQSQVIVPSSVEGQDNKRTVTLSVTPPYGFGWHNELRTISIDFVAQASPPGSFEKTGVYHFQVMIRNKGFSLPGFELVLLLIAFLVISILMKKRNNQQK
jgi:hypothetical protein